MGWESFLVFRCAVSRLCLKRGLTLWRQAVFCCFSALAGEGQTPFQTELVLVIPIADVDEVSFDGRGGSHRGADQVGPSALALAAFEVAIAGAGTAFPGRQLIGVHGQTHAASGLTPIKAGFDKNLVEPFFLGLQL